MRAWHISIVAPPTRMAMLRRGTARRGAVLAAIAALAATVLLGWSDPASLGGTPQTLAGMGAVAGLGLLVWLIARLTVLPLADPSTAALAAALVPPVLFPGIGDAALAVPVLLAVWMGWRRSDLRGTALLVPCGALAIWSDLPATGPAAGPVIAAMLGLAWILAVRTLSGAANDNPQMERLERFPEDSRARQTSCYATKESIPGKWGVP
jgi:hypothetical protein